MGREIVYCSWCSSRILEAAFDKGAALVIENRACCPECLPKVLASMPENQRAALESAPPRGGTEPSPVRTPRPAPVVLPQPQASPMKLAIIIGLLAAVVALLLLLTGDRKEPPAPIAAPPPAPQTQNRIDVDPQAKLREEAALLVRQKEAVAQELVRLLDTVAPLIKDSNFKKALDILAAARGRHGSPEWTSAIDRKLEDVRKAEASGGAYLPVNAPDDIVCMEAERFHRKSDVGEHAWTPVAAPGGFIGAGAMAALPNKGAQFKADLLSPRMEYRVRFARPGKYYVWVRGWAEGGDSDTLHVGLNGKESKASNMAIGGKMKWIWGNRIRIGPGVFGPAALLDVPSEGEHAVTVWMREDGSILDRILLTTNAKYVPDEGGPPETSR